MCIFVVSGALTICQLIVCMYVQASASDPENVYLSISMPSLSHDASPSTGLPEFTLQEARKMYHKFAEIVEPTKEGYALTLKLNFSGLTRPKGRHLAKSCRRLSAMIRVTSSSCVPLLEVICRSRQGC